MRLLRICPDCDEVISYNTHFNAFMHTNETDCAYMENVDGKRIWDNKTREENLKQLDGKECEDNEQLSIF